MSMLQFIWLHTTLLLPRADNSFEIQFYDPDLLIMHHLSTNQNVLSHPTSRDGEWVLSSISLSCCVASWLS